MKKLAIFGLITLLFTGTVSGAVELEVVIEESFQFSSNPAQDQITSAVKLILSKRGFSYQETTRGVIVANNKTKVLEIHVKDKFIKVVSKDRKSKDGQIVFGSEIAAVITNDEKTALEEECLKTVRYIIGGTIKLVGIRLDMIKYKGEIMKK